MKRKGSLVPIGSFLETYFEKKGWSSKLQEYKIFTHWDRLVGKHLSTKCQPSFLHHDSLTVLVSNSTWLTELQFMKITLLNKVRRELHISLRDIVFKVDDRRNRYQQ